MGGTELARGFVAAEAPQGGTAIQQKSFFRPGLARVRLETDDAEGRHRVDVKRVNRLEQRLG
jgi:hypothetical protein